MAIYNAYLEGAEREAAILEMEFDNQYEKLSMLYEMSLMELNQVKKDLELKVFKESGTYDDLEYLISEAEEQAGQDQKNILSQILDWFSRAIQKMVTSIKNFFTGAKNVPDDSEVNAPAEFFDADKDSKASSILKMLQGIDENTAPNFFETAIGKILGVGVAAGSIFVINRAVSKSNKVKAKAVKDEVKKAEGMEAQLNAVIGKIKQTLDKAANLPIIGQFSTTAKTVLDNTVKPISDWLQDKINWGAELLKTNEVVQGAANAVNNGINAAKDKINNLGNKAAGNAPAADNKNAGPDQVKGANLNSSKTGIVASVLENGITRKINLSGEGVVTNAEDKKPISAALKQLVEGSAQVAAAKERFAKAKELLAKKAQTATTPKAESADDLQIDFGDEYTLEFTDDGFFVNINTVIEMPEDYLSTTQSIFGMIAEEEASEDPELEELQKLFSEF